MIARDIRRKERAISRDAALDILRRGQYGVLSSVGPDGQPYGVPLSYCVIGNAVYFHCAVEGQKLDNLAANNRVSFCVVGDTEVLREQFAIRYESAIVFGAAEEVFDADKQEALEALLRKYSDAFFDKGLKYIDNKSPETRVFKVAIDHLSGKARA